MFVCYGDVSWVLVLYLQQTLKNIFKQIDHLVTPSFQEYFNRWERRLSGYCSKLLLSDVWKIPNNCNNELGQFKQPHILILKHCYWTPSLRNFRDRIFKLIPAIQEVGGNLHICVFWILNLFNWKSKQRECEVVLALCAEPKLLWDFTSFNF